jgi:hypothetical protein
MLLKAFSAQKHSVGVQDQLVMVHFLQIYTYFWLLLAPARPDFLTISSLAQLKLYARALTSLSTIAIDALHGI